MQRHWQCKIDTNTYYGTEKGMIRTWHVQRAVRRSRLISRKTVTAVSQPGRHTSQRAASGWRPRSLCTPSVVCSSTGNTLLSPATCSTLFVETISHLQQTATVSRYDGYATVTPLKFWWQNRKIPKIGINRREHVFPGKDVALQRCCAVPSFALNSVEMCRISMTTGGWHMAPS